MIANPEDAAGLHYAARHVTNQQGHRVRPDYRVNSLPMHRGAAVVLNYTYVDNSNVFIEGQFVSAVAKGDASDVYDAHARWVPDHGWKLDYGKLHSLVCGAKHEIGAANLWGSPPPGDSFWQFVKSKGFDVKTYDRSVSGKEKKVDVALAHRMTKDAYTIIDKANSEISLAAGDKDYVPVVEDLTHEGFHVVVVFWDHAATELKEAASEFFSLNAHLDHLTV